MKKLFLSSIAVMIVNTLFAAPYFWIGGTSGNWSAVSNWSASSGGPAGLFAPGANDDVTFDNGLSVTVSYDLATNDVGFASFRVINNTQLTLENTLAATRSLTINNVPSNYYEVVQTGSSLTLKSNTNNVFNFGSATLSSGRMVFNGEVYCVNQAINTSGGPRLNAQDSIIINKLLYVGPGIASGSNPTGANKFRVSSGATYQIDKNGGVIIGGTWQPGSLIKVTGSVSAFPSVWLGTPLYGGIEYDTPAANSAGISNIVLPANTVFQGDFKVTNLGTSAGLRFASNPVNITIQGDLIINSGLVNLSNGTTDAVINVFGKLTQQGGTTLDIQGSAANTILKVGGDINSAGTITESGTSAGSGIELNGTVAQQISLTGSLSNDVSFTINNPAGAVALTDINLPQGINAKLNLTSGNINVLANNKMIRIQNPSVNAINGGTLASHVIGSLIRSSNAVAGYYFPVSGNAADLAEATISTISPDATDWTVSFIRSNPDNGTGLPAGINLISPYRWDISRTGTSPSDAATVNLKYVNISGNGIISPASIKMVRWNGASWDDLGGASDGSGGINSVASPLSNFGSFSFGGPLGALPVKINYFTGVRQVNKHLLSWKLDCTNTPYVNMHVERSADGRNYEGIYTLQADAIRCLQAFDFIDANPLKGRNYYRLKIMDADGRDSYSTIIVLLNKPGGFELISIAPNPVQDIATLAISSSVTVKATVVIRDAAGKKIRQKVIQLIAGNNNVLISLGQLGTGVYHLSAIIDGETVQALSFLKK